jgi:glycosyltransferase involved in cell wall biosynthesis
MIVKNEAHTLPRLAASLAGQIDHWTIVDTGSSDGTPDVARRAFGGAKGAVIEDEWRGYGPSRNVALGAAREETDWVLTLDADETVHGVIDRRGLRRELDGLTGECRYVNLRYWVPRLLRAEAGWQWRGRAHEYLWLPGREPRQDRTTSFWVEHHGDGGNRADKFARELGLLEADWDDQVDPARTAFYVARTYEDMGQLAPAATWYRRRIALGGWAEETWYARWRLGCCLLATGRAEEGCGVLWSAWSDRPWRAEPLCSLAEHYRLASQWEAAWQACAASFRRCHLEPWRSPGDPPPANGDTLFVHADVYEWRLAYETSIAAWYAGEHRRGRQACDYLVSHPSLPDELRSNVIANEAFYERPWRRSQG